MCLDSIKILISRKCFPCGNIVATILARSMSGWIFCYTNITQIYLFCHRGSCNLDTIFWNVLLPESALLLLKWHNLFVSTLSLLIPFFKPHVFISLTCRKTSGFLIFLFKILTWLLLPSFNFPFYRYRHSTSVKYRALQSQTYKWEIHAEWLHAY